MRQPRPRLADHLNLAPEERRSITHSDFWIPEDEREVYKRALLALNDAGVRYVVAGAYAIHEHTGIYRQTKDLDLFFEPAWVLPAAAALKDAGFTMRLEYPHWLVKAFYGACFIDLIFGMGNGVALVDDQWYRYSSPGVLAATPVRVAPTEELLWHRLFISERHRYDMADVVHLIVCVGDVIEWRRLVERVGEHWPLLLAQLQTFSYVYPGYRSRVPDWVLNTLIERAREDVGRDHADAELTRGPLISRFSFSIDIAEWGFRDARSDLVATALADEDVQRIRASAVWDSRADENQPAAPDEIDP